MKWSCPYCRRALEVESPDDLPYLPFCSARCQMADLHGWLAGRYVISRPLTEADAGDAPVTATEPPAPEATTDPPADDAPPKAGRK
jgi:endogenous inhibitor of DNA gyrase (YacG/DUF329 family)